MHKNPTIIITGATRSGKTVMAALIAKALVEAGCTPIVIDEGYRVQPAPFTGFACFGDVYIHTKEQS